MEDSTPMKDPIPEGGLNSQRRYQLPIEDSGSRWKTQLTTEESTRKEGSIP